jgi:WD40 repeat protein
MGMAPPEVLRQGHVFLSHAGADTQAARQFAEILRRNGIEVWFDKDNLQPGDNWMAALEEAIARASAMIVYVGSSGIQAWVDREVRFGLVRNTASREAFRLIPVMGEGADLAKLPPFAQQQQCVDQRDPEQVRRLIETLRTASSSETAIPADYWTTHSPFRSLQIFGPEDSWLFFGRDRDTDELLTRLGRAPALAVIGNSGSGKSSLIQAGLIPALRRGRFRYGGKWVDSWRIAVFRPSIAPFDYLAEALPGQLAPELGPKDRAEFTGYCKRKLPEGGDGLRNCIAALMSPTDQTSGGEHVLLVADQFEELFTLVPDQATRSRYIDALLAAAGLGGAVPVHLVLALRADFYGHCLEYPSLGAALDTNPYNVPGMSPAQLRQAIENRLALAAASAEAGLIDSLLADVGAEPGNLALLEHALAQLWQKCGGSGRTLTGDAYAEIGRLKGALGRHADEVYRGLGGEADQQLAQKIFLELVQLGEGAQDTRRRVPKEALLHLGAREQVERVIAELASKRLVATGGQGSGSPAENFVEVSHEALIREWPALRGWLKDNREDLRLGRLLEQAAEEWRELKRDPSALMQGVRLVQGREWLSRHTNAPALLAEFLQSSNAAEEEAARNEREAQEREIARQKESLRQAEARAAAEERLRVAEETAAARARRSAVRSRRFSYGLGLLVLIAAGAAIFARSQQLTAQSRALAQAEQMMVRDAPAALALAIRGWNTGKTVEANLAIAHAFPQLLARLEGHTGFVWRAAFSPDGQRIVTAANDGTARVWNAANGQLLIKLEGHVENVWQAAFSPDGQRIVTACDYTAQIWNAADGRLLATLEDYASDFKQAAFSPDGQRIVTAGGDHRARVWNAFTGQLLATLAGHTSVVGQAEFSPDGKHIVTSSYDHTARVWQASTGQLLATLAGHTDNVMHAAFSPDGQRIVTASVDQTARVWSATNGQLLATLAGHTSVVGQAAFSPDGQRIVTGSADHTARIWKAAGGQLLARLEGHTDNVLQAAFSPDGQRIVTASVDHTARVWSAANGRLLARLEGHTDTVWQAAFSRDGQRIVTASSDHTARVWNLASVQLLATLEGNVVIVWQAAFSPDSQRILTAGDNRARVWNAANGQLLTTLAGHTNVVGQAAFSPDGKHIVTSSCDHTARVWNAAKGQLLVKLAGHTDYVVHAAYSPDGQRIVTASWDSTARVWNASNGQLVAKLEGHRGKVVQAAFSPDGQRIVTASGDHTARVWNASTGQLLAKLEGHEDDVWQAAFSPDGQRIVTASDDDTACLWNASTGQLLARLEGHEGNVRQAAFSPDGQRVVTASWDSTARVWNASTGRLLAKLEGHTGDVVQAAFSPDGQRIVTASEDHTARLWNAANGQVLAKLEGHADALQDAAFSPDGQRIATAGEHTARVYRVVTISEIAELLGK